MAGEPNPFDQFDNEPPDSAAAVLKPGPDPSLWELFKENIRSTSAFNQSSDSFENAPGRLADARLIEKVENRTGVAQPGDSPLLGKPSQQEYDEARARLAAAKRQKERDDALNAFSSHGITGTAVGLTGNLIGAIASPINIISAGGLFAKVGASVFGRLGMGGTGARIAGVGLEAGAVNAVLDIPTQVMRIGAGIEEKYDPARTALAFGAGQVLGSGMAGVAHLVRSRRALSAAEQGRVDEYIVARDRELAGGRLTQENAGDNLPQPSIVPGADAAKLQPDVLARITEAAKAGQETEGGLIKLEISSQERDALRTAGYPVADDNTVPQSVIADLARREATQPVEVTARADAPASTETPATALPNEANPPTERMGTPEQGAGQAVTSGAEVRPASDAVQPEARLGQQQGLGQQRLSAPQAISLEPIRRDLGLDIPGTLKKPIPIVDYLRGEATARQYPITTAPAVMKAREIIRDSLDMPESIKSFDGNIRKPAVKGAPVGVFMFDATKLRTDAQRFQYKDNGDTEGVTNALKSVTKWDPAKANQLIIWQDTANRLFVVDGHQRSGLARRLVAQGNEQSISLPGILYREADGVSSEYVRAIAAAKNIAEGSGSPIDGAKVLRSHPELLDGSMPITRTESRQAFDLARLDDEAFRMVINEVVPYQQAAIVGRLIPNDGPRQAAAMKAIARFEPRNEAEAATLIQRVSQSELAKSEGDTGNLFGDMMGAESTAGEEMRIVARAVAELKKDKNLLSRVVANADRIEQAGSQIDRGSARSVADDAEVFAKVITSNAYSAGPVRSELIRLAKEIQGGTKTVNDASREILAAVRAEAERSVRAGSSDSGNARGPATETGADGKPQTLIPGVEPITDRQRLEAQAGKPLQGGDNAPPAGGLFDDNARAQGDLLAPQALLAKRNSGPPLNPDPNSRFPQRQDLPGEGGARTIPANATPEEIASFRITEQHRAVAERLGLKLETDGRFTLKGVLGEYKPKEGVLRIRFDGDTSVFNHELGHAIDQRLRRNPATSPDMQAAISRNAAELRALDSNTTDPTKQTTTEGIAEFIRMYLDQPAYARKQAPNFADEFDRLVVKDPELKAVMEDAYRATQIDSGMEPMQRMSSMIAPAEDAKGWRRWNEERKKYGLPMSLQLMADRFYAGLAGHDVYAGRFWQLLKDAHFEKNGKPLPRQFSADGYQKFRMISGARQAAIDGFYEGVRSHGDPWSGPQSASLKDGISIALNGALHRMDDVNDPLYKAFNGYLIARRGRHLYDRWEVGEIRNPPVRASRNEVLQSIADFERTYPQFVEAADKVFSYANAMFKKDFDAGFTSVDVYNAVLGRGGEYVPYFRDMGDAMAKGSGRGGSTDPRGKALQGSSRNILDPIRSLMYAAAKTEIAIAENEAKKALVRMAEVGGEFAGKFIERIPNTELHGVTADIGEMIRNAAKMHGSDPASVDGIIKGLEHVIGDDLTATAFRGHEILPSGERIIFIYEAGERAAYKIGNDPFSKNFFDYISNMNPPQRDVFFAALGKANSLFSQLITNAPSFGLGNLIGDNMSRIGIARDVGLVARIPFASIAKGWWTQAFNREFAQTYAASGGHRGGVVAAASRDLMARDAARVIDLAPKSLKERMLDTAAEISTVKGIAFAPFKTVGAILEGIAKIVESTETTGRIGQAKFIFDHLRKNGASEADAWHGALFESRDLLDYDRKGFAMQQATRFIPFLNPNIQGVDRANRALLGAPLKAAVEAYKRKGYANLDADTKAILKDAVINWGVVAIMAAATYEFAHWAADQIYYQKQSEYMRRRYWNFPAGTDSDGREMVIGLRKPFDLPGAIANGIEGAIYSQRRNDGKTWERVSKAFEDAMIPRVFTGVSEFASANPVGKLAAEISTGKKIPFDGGESFPIEPQTKRSLPPDRAYTASTSWFAKMLGKNFGVRPMMADHIINGLGGNAFRDANLVLTAAVGENPNITMKHAMNRMFFASQYRAEGNGGNIRADLFKLMGNDNGKYTIAVNGYKEDLALGDKEAAEKRYAEMNDTAKTLATLRSVPRFRPEDRVMHPLQRTSAIGEILSNVARDLANGELEFRGGVRRKTKVGEERNIYEIEPRVARTVSNIIESLMGEETRNGLATTGEPGYAGLPMIDTSGRYKAIESIDPDIAKEIRDRMKSAHIPDPEVVQRNWPELKRRLLLDRSTARIGDLRR